MGIAIDVKGLNVKYKIVNSVNFKNEIIKVLTKKESGAKVKEVWALKDVSFQVEQGSNVGIIGTNGSGKTTLLKTIANIFQPDSGTVSLHSDSVSLLTLGVGFQPELSGYENIYLNGMLLGFKKKQIDEKVNEIIEFSELEDFVYYPIKTYSAGMKTRLAFSIAAHIESDILLIDEVLGVGDESFKAKSKAKLDELINENRTVILISHSLNTIKESCDKVLWLHKGVVKGYGEPEEMINQYLDFVKKNG